MTRPLDDDLRELLAARANVHPEEREPLRRFVASLPARRRVRHGLLAAAAGIVVLLGLGGILVTQLPFGTSGAAPSAPNPASPSPAPTSALPAQIDPADCVRMKFAEDRCLAVVLAALEQQGLTLNDVQGVTVVETPTDPASLGSHPVATVTWRLLDGSSGSQEVRCGGIGGQYSLVCTDRPEIRLSAPFGPGGGYHDTPCTGEAPDGCATPMPTIDPGAASAAEALKVASHDYPIAGLGRQEILVGRAVLPNGILSDARFSLADPFTRAFTVRDGVALVVRSLDPARPAFDNIYSHGWYPGTEAVEVYLVFDITAVMPGAALEIRDLVVR